MSVLFIFLFSFNKSYEYVSCALRFGPCLCDSRGRARPLFLSFSLLTWMKVRWSSNSKGSLPNPGCWCPTLLFIFRNVVKISCPSNEVMTSGLQRASVVGVVWSVGSAHVCVSGKLINVPWCSGPGGSRPWSWSCSWPPDLIWLWSPVHWASSCHPIIPLGQGWVNYGPGARCGPLSGLIWPNDNNKPSWCFVFCISQEVAHSTYTDLCWGHSCADSCTWGCIFWCRLNAAPRTHIEQKHQDKMSLSCCWKRLWGRVMVIYHEG